MPQKFLRRRSDRPHNLKSVRKQLAEVFDFRSREHVHWISGNDDYAAFLNDLARIRFILDEVETYRDYECTSRNADIGFDRLRERQRDLKRAVIGLQTRAHLLPWLTLAHELEEWLDNSAVAITSTTARDTEFDDRDEIVLMRMQLRTWAVLATLHRIFRRQLRRAVGRNTPANEREIQDLIETLIIANDIPYVREHDVTTLTLERRRPDFRIPPIETLIEIKLCPSPERIARIQSEIRDDQVFSEDYRRLLFVIYDCGCIDDPTGYAYQLEQSFGSSDKRAMSVIVIKQ